MYPTLTQSHYKRQMLFSIHHNEAVGHGNGTAQVFAPVFAKSQNMRLLGALNHILARLGEAPSNPRQNLGKTFALTYILSEFAV